MSERHAIYLDSNAGAPLHPKVVEALLPFLSKTGNALSFPNPSSIHSQGRRAKRLVSDAREAVALSLGPNTDPEQIVFTSGGTEANQLVIRSVLEAALAKKATMASSPKPHWITTPVEHDSVRQLIPWFESRGGKVSLLPVDEQGRPEVKSLEALWQPGTALVSAVWANNETGVLTDVQALASETRRLGGLLHVDGAQAWGKITIDVESLGAHFVTFSAHKIGGLAGAGAVWIARGARLDGLVAGKQEKGRRGGTENLIGIVAMGAAARSIDPAAYERDLAPLRDRLERAICDRIPGTQINGAGAPRVANTLNLSFDGIGGDGLIMALDLAGFCVSSGSACSSGVLEPSHVLLAMGRTREQATAAVRVSLHRGLEWEEIEGFVPACEKVILGIEGSR